MSRVCTAAGLVLALVFPAACSSSPMNQSGISSQPETSELYRAVSIAVARSVNVLESRGEFKLISAQQVIVNGKYIWRITLKPVSLLPDDPSTREIGAGGEIFVNVDLDTEEAIITYANRIE